MTTVEPYVCQDAPLCYVGTYRARGITAQMTMSVDIIDTMLYMQGKANETASAPPPMLHEVAKLEGEEALTTAAD